MPDQPPTPPPAPPSPAVLALIRDLMFSSRVTATARALGAAVKLLRDPALLAGEPGRRLIVDLNLPGAVEAAAAWKAAGGGAARTVTGFVAHVDAETIHRARAAGLDRVMARSQFVQVLPDLLRPDAAGGSDDTAEPEGAGGPEGAAEPNNADGPAGA